MPVPVLAILSSVDPEHHPLFNEATLRWLIWGGTGLAVHVLMWLLLWVLVGRRKDLSRRVQQRRALVVILAFLILTFAWLALIPASESVRNLFLTLFGVGVTGLVTLSSTTLAANFMAGLMLRQVRSFRLGDFVRVEEHFGRVSGRGLFHVELQTVDRDLMTLPNAYLISRPLRVVRTSGTMVSCEVSIGYDVPHEVVERVLLASVESTGLTDGYVLVLDLLDHAVSYRAAGFLKDVESILSTRSRLRRAVLCEMRRAGVEIVSPQFMNQRQVQAAVIPEEPDRADVATASENGDADFEKLVFDKAEDAQRVENVDAKLADAKARSKALASELKSCPPEARHDLELRLAGNEKVVQFLERLRERLESK